MRTTQNGDFFTRTTQIGTNHTKSVPKCARARALKKPQRGNRRQCDHAHNPKMLTISRGYTETLNYIGLPIRPCFEREIPLEPYDVVVLGRMHHLHYEVDGAKIVDQIDHHNTRRYHRRAVDRCATDEEAQALDMNRIQHRSRQAGWLMRLKSALTRDAKIRYYEIHDTLNQLTISRLQCLISHAGDDYWIRDVDASNPILVNSEPVTGESRRLVDGDTISVMPLAPIVQQYYDAFAGKTRNFELPLEPLGPRNRVFTQYTFHANKKPAEVVVETPAPTPTALPPFKRKPSSVDRYMDSEHPTKKRK